MEFCCNFLFDSRILRSSICWSVAITRTFQFPIALTFSRQPDYFARCLKRKTSFVCTLQVRFLLLPFPIVSVAIWVTFFAHFDRCLYLFQWIFCIWNFLPAVFLASVGSPQWSFDSIFQYSCELCNIPLTESSDPTIKDL